MRLDIPRRLHGQLWRFRSSVGELRSHRHPQLELQHVLRGHATLAVGGRRLPLAARSLTFVPPRREHQVVDPSDDFEMWIACFRPRLVRRTCDRAARGALLASRSPAPEVHTLDAPEARRLGTLLAEVSAYEDAAAYNAGLAYLLARAWLDYVQAVQSAQAPE
jgi:hypothetical protein